MYPISEKSRELIYSGGAFKKALLTINDTEIDRTLISKIEIENPMFDETLKVFQIGQFISNKIKVTFKNMDSIPTSGNVELSIGISDKIDGTYEMIPIGKYIIDYSEEDYYKNNTITCLDYAINMKTAVDYSELITFDEQGSATSGVTIKNLLIWLCNHYQIELGTYPNVNNDYEIKVYDNTKSGKYYISMIAELMGGNAKIGRDGKLNIIPLKQNHQTTINALKSSEWTLNDKYTISKVIYDNGVIKVEKGTDTGNTFYIRNENMFILDNYETLITNIYNSIVGSRIDSLKTKNYGDISLDCWDIIKYELGTEIYYTYNNNKTVYQQSLMSTVETKIPSETQTSTTNILESSTEEKVRKLETKINQDELSITTIAEQTSENSTEISRTTQNLNEISREVTSSIDSLRQTTEQIQTSTSLQIETIQNTIENGVENLKNKLVTIDIEGIKVSSEQDKFQSLFSNKAVEIKNSYDEIAFFGYDEELNKTIARIKELETEKMSAGYHRCEPFEDNLEKRTGWFWRG